METGGAPVSIIATDFSKGAPDGVISALQTAAAWPAQSVASGQILQAEVVPLAGWSDFVAKRLDWIKDSLPTIEQLQAGPRAMVYYSPKIVQQ